MRPRALLIPASLVVLAAALNLTRPIAVQADETRDRAQLRARVKLLEAKVASLEKLAGEQQATLEELRLRQGERAAPRERPRSATKLPKQEAESVTSQVRRLAKLERAMVLEPDDPSHAIRLGLAFLEAGRREQGTRLLGGVIAHLDLAQSSFANLKELLEQAAIEPTPERLQVLAMRLQSARAFAERRRRQFEESREKLERARPDHAEFKELLEHAKELAQKHDSQQLAKVLEQALRMRPDRVELRIELAKALATLGRISEAVRHVEHALKDIDVPGRPEIPGHLIPLDRDARRMLEKLKNAHRR
jgi:tetratricopeptide (TPR) repeat protein